MAINKDLFPKRLRAARRAKGMTQADVAEAMGVNRVTSTNWETGLYAPDPSKVIVMSQLLGVATEWLAGESEEGGVEDPPQRNFSIRRERTDPEWVEVLHHSSECPAVPGEGCAKTCDRFAAQTAMPGFFQVRKDRMASRGVTLLMTVMAKGDAMQPTIESGDFVFLDAANKTPSGVVAIVLSGSIEIRRLVPLVGDRVFVVCDNPNYTAQEAQISDLAVVGRVISISRDV